MKQYSDLVGFVPQDDIMHRDLTVKENLTVYAKLRLPAGSSRRQRRRSSSVEGGSTPPTWCETSRASCSWRP